MPRRLILFTIFLLLLQACKPEPKKSENVLALVPPNSALLIRINTLDQFKSQIKNNSFFGLLEKSETPWDSFAQKLDLLEHLNTSSTSLLAIAEVGKGNPEFTFSTPFKDIQFEADSIPGITSTASTYEGTAITQYQFGTSELHTATIDGIFIGASTRLLLENTIRAQESGYDDPVFLKLYQSANSKKTANVFLAPEASDGLFASLLNSKSTHPISGLTDWLLLDMDISQDHLALTGASMANDSIKNKFNLLANTQPLPPITPSLAPTSSTAFWTLTFADYGNFAANHKRYLDKVPTTDTLFHKVQEVGVILLNQEKLTVINTEGNASLQTYLKANELGSSNYQGSEIVHISEASFLQEAFSSFISPGPTAYYTTIGDAFVFSQNQESLQTLLGNYKNGTTYNKTETYATATEHLAQESSFLFVGGSEGLSALAEAHMSDSWRGAIKDLKMEDYTLAAQIVADGPIFHTNILVKQIKPQSQSNTAVPLFTVALDNDIQTRPQFVTDHRSKKKEIVVQDTDNNLYLINGKGKVLWKKQLSGPIQGDIHQVDLYKNGKLQLAFTTDKEFLILDRNGNEVPPFNKEFPNPNLSPLAVFDYDKNKNYRFVFGEGKNIHMYDNKLQSVKGFTFNTAPGPLTQAAAHFRLGNKDFLVFTADNSLHLLNRRGQTRIQTPGTGEVSANGVKIYQDKFTFTDQQGILHQIDLDGKNSSANLGLSEHHGMDATNKTLVTLSGNTISIRSKEVTLEHGLYTSPQLFLVSNKIYVATTDLQNQKVYLFDSQAEPLANFPVYGSSTVDMADMDGDGKVELVVKDTDNSLIVYAIH